MRAASFSVANAYIDEVTSPEERSKSFGLLGAVFGIGFIVGPTGVIEGFLHHHWLEQWLDEAEVVIRLSMLGKVLLMLSSSVVASVGTSRLRSTDSIAAAFRVADRTLDPVGGVPA